MPPQPLVALFCTASPQRATMALEQAMLDAGYRRTLGLAHDPEDAARDPHDRNRRFFRLLPVGGGWTAIVERDTPEAADYLLARSLTVRGVAPVVYVALSADRSQGMVSRMEGLEEAQELFLRDGQADPEVSTVEVPSGGPDALLVGWDVHAGTLPDYDRAPGPSETFLRAEARG